MRTALQPIVGPDGAGRNETELERCDRNLVELLQEVRVVQTGVQVLFAFLLTAPLAPRFPSLIEFQRLTYFDAAVVVATTAIATLGCASLWCVAPLLRRARLVRRLPG